MPMAYTPPSQALLLRLAYRGLGCELPNQGDEQDEHDRGQEHHRSWEEYQSQTVDEEKSNYDAVGSEVGEEEVFEHWSKTFLVLSHSRALFHGLLA